MDTLNKFGVGVVGGDIAVMASPRRITPDEAKMLAAWLVTMAEIQDPNLPPFSEYQKAVQET